MSKILKLWFVALLSTVMITQAVPKNALSSDIIDFVKHTTQDFAIGMMFSYVHSSFEQYQKEHPIKYGVLSQYVSGKYVYNDMDRLYSGETLLHKAVVRRDIDLVTTLLFLGANPLEKNAQGITAIELAQKLQESSIKKVLELYAQEQKKLFGRSDLELLHQTIVSKMVRLAAPFAADQGLNAIIESLQLYGAQHPILSRIFMYGIRGYRFDSLINSSWYQSTFLQRCMLHNYQEFAKILLYLGADPLGCNKHGYSAFDEAVKTSNLSFVKMFWLYVSSPAIKDEMYPKLEKYKIKLLSLARDEYLHTKSAVFLADVATYFNVVLDLVPA